MQVSANALSYESPVYRLRLLIGNQRFLSYKLGENLIMKKIFLLLILLSSTQVFAEKIDDCEDFYEIAKEVMTVRQSGMDQMEYRNSTKKQFKGRELSRRLNLIDQAYTRQYFGHIPELKEGVKTQIKTFAERAYKLCKRGEW